MTEISQLVAPTEQSSSAGEVREGTSGRKLHQDEGKETPQSCNFHKNTSIKGFYVCVSYRLQS